MTLQLTTDSGQWGQISSISYCYQKVSILWVGFICRERANESKTLDTRKSRGCAYECQYFSKEQRSQIEGTITGAGAFPINDPADLPVLEENIGWVEVEMHHVVGLKMLIPVRQNNRLQHSQ